MLSMFVTDKSRRHANYAEYTLPLLRKKKVSLFLLKTLLKQRDLITRTCFDMLCVKFGLDAHRLQSLAITCSWWQNTFKFSHIFAAECLPIWTQHEISGMWEHNENMVPVVVTSNVSTRLYTIVEHDFNYLSSL